jgi:thioredoxin 1
MPRDKQYATYTTLDKSSSSNSNHFKQSSEESQQRSGGPTPVCLEIQSAEHRQKVLQANSIVCIDLHANWCSPCKVVSPKFAELSKEYNSPGKCLLVKEDTDLGLTTDCDITGIPAFIFYRFKQLVRTPDNKPVMVVGGNLKKVREILDNLLNE